MALQIDTGRASSMEGGFGWRERTVSAEINLKEIGEGWRCETRVKECVRLHGTGRGKGRKMVMDT